jgi:predicted esterase
VRTHVAPSRTVLIGYSLGASVALAASAGESQLAGIVVWSGSLPDTYVRLFHKIPPLLILHGARDGVCKLSIYNAEGHAFSGKGITQADG